jgi:hypothetical protein
MTQRVNERLTDVGVEPTEDSADRRIWLDAGPVHTLYEDLIFGVLPRQSLNYGRFPPTKTQG